MSYDWLERLVMGVIFFSASLYAIRHLVPGLYQGAKHFFLRQNPGVFDVAETNKRFAAARKSKCATCNGCTLANKS